MIFWHLSECIMDDGSVKIKQMLAGQSISNRLKRKVKPLMFITTPPKDLASWITLLKAAKIRKYTFQE